MFIAHAKAVLRSHCLGRGSCLLRHVRSRSGRLKRRQVPLAGVQRIMRSTVHSIAVHLRIWEVARSRTAVVAPFAVADPERIGRATVVNTAWIVVVLANQTRQRVTRARTAVHGGDRCPRLGVLVNHVRLPSGD